MAAQDKDLQKHFDDLAIAASKAAKQLNSAADNLSNKGVDKLTDSVKTYLRTSKTLNDSQLEQIKSFSELEKTVVAFENQIDSLVDAEKELTKNYKKRLREAQNSSRIQEKLTEQHEKETAVIRDSINAKVEESKKLKEFIDVQGTAIRNIDGLNKAHEDLTKSIKSQISHYISLTYAGSKLKEGLKESYQTMHQISEKGMLGSVGAMITASKQLMMTTAQFSDVVQKNRDLVNQYGGGAKGVLKLGDQIGAVTKDLKFLGQNAGAGAAKLVELTKIAGFTANDGAIYEKEMKSTVKQYKKFASLFGESAEQYATLMQSQYEEESTRNKLNSMNKDARFALKEEIRERTENYKMLGLSNEQIADFNKRTEEMNNPRASGQIVRRNREGIASMNAVQMLTNSIDPNSDEGKNLAKHKDALDQYSKMSMNGASPDELKKFGSENAEAFKAFADAKTWIDKNKDQRQREEHNRMFDRTGQTGASMESLGKAVSSAEADGKSLKSLSPEKLKEVLDASAKGLDNLTVLGVNLGGAFQTLAENIGKFNSYWDDGFYKNLVGLGVGILSIMSLFNVFRKGFGLVISLLGKFTGGTAAKAVTEVAGTAAEGVAGAKGATSGLGKFGKFMGKWGGPAVGTALAGVQAYNIVNDDTMTAEQKKKAGSKLAGSTAGAWAGAEAGATIGGSLGLLSGPFAPIVAPVGALVGGAIGGIAGYQEGATIGGYAYDKLSGDPTKKSAADARQNFAKTDPRRVDNSANPGSNQTPAVMNSSSTSGPNDIAKIVDTGPGWLTVQRPNGNVEKLSGARNWRNNNPGNIEYGNFAATHGAIGSDGRFAIFPTYDIGRKAKASLIFDGKNYKDLDLKSAIGRYAPSFENDTGAYQNSVLSSVGGVNKKMSDYTDEERNNIMDSMQKVEGFKVGKTTEIGNTVGTPNFVQNGQTAIDATGYTVPTSSSTPNGASTAVPLDPSLDHWSRQNAILQQIANNTRGKNGRFQADPSVVSPNVTA